MAESSPVPIRDSVGEALRFTRENWRYVLSAAGLAAAAAGASALIGANLIWMLIVLVALLAAHTALTSAALDLPRGFTNRLTADSARVGAVMAMIGFFLAIIFFLLLFVAMSVLIAPYQAELQAAGEDEAAVRAIMNTALESNPGVIAWTMLVGAVVAFAVTTRLYVAAPATIDSGRIKFFESWRLTRGNFLRIASARLMLLGPAFILVYALQALVARVLGAPGGDPFALLAYSQQNALGFALFYSASVFVQIAVFYALEAALSAKIYRHVKAPVA